MQELRRPSRSGDRGPDPRINVENPNRNHRHPAPQRKNLKNRRPHDPLDPLRIWGKPGKAPKRGGGEPRPPPPTPPAVLMRRTVSMVPPTPSSEARQAPTRPKLVLPQPTPDPVDAGPAPKRLLPPTFLRLRALNQLPVSSVDCQ